ncbi:hypothetical protein UA08_03945 [Talaromyces atroroseus]|uniref:Indoleamine 2,3-dioxygenase n=1 Tax=Talaromyces atroroseus TaxID=1441469 RepID=A0A1Q5Q921_TALAT|nr:hypothetical protein UA08_03945 [Talaromyces atroroseus]OKL60562.1 hypothetical protein UA08_03945 [Talaromyces atroroseus]
MKMPGDIPDPEKYDISLITGFLPAESPPDSLPSPYYAKWNYVAQNMQELLTTKRLRVVVENLEVLACDRLDTISQMRTAYSTLAFISHAYIWGGETSAEVVPRSISIPFLSLCEKLELPPVATYAAVVLWNFKPISAAERLDCLENLTARMTFTGAIDESWFYMVSVAFEARGGLLIAIVMEAIRSIYSKDALSLAVHLRRLGAALEGLPALLQRMYEKCDPQFYYDQVRPFLAGSKNVSKAGLPRGVVFDDGTGRMQPVQFAGGSNAQSSLIQFLDIALGVKHQPESSGTRRANNEHASPSDVRGLIAPEQEPVPLQPKEEPQFILEMRQYMPGPHRRFLDRLDCVTNIRDFINANPGNNDLFSSYSACLAALVRFRNIHLQMVARYIVLPSRKIVNQARLVSIATSHHKAVSSEHCLDDKISSRLNDIEANDDLIGTGGTNLMPFLKHVRDETQQLLDQGSIDVR